MFVIAFGIVLALVILNPDLGVGILGLRPVGAVASAVADMSGVQIDDLTQQYLTVHQHVAPLDDGADGERALAVQQR